MKKSFIAWLLSLLFIFLTVSSCIGEAVQDPEDGMYTWTIGNGLVLNTKTNIMEYLSDGVWNSNQMAIDLGWTDWDQQLTARQPTGYAHDGVYVRLEVSHPDTDVITDWFCFAIHYSNYADPEHSFQYQVELPRELGEYEYSEKRSHYSISFDGIVLFTYACEHLMEDKNTDPFQSVFGELNYGEYQYFLYSQE